MILIVSPNLAVDQRSMWTIWSSASASLKIHAPRARCKGVNVARVLTTLDVPCLLTGFVVDRKGSSSLRPEGGKDFFPALSNSKRESYLLLAVDDERLQQTVVNEPGPVIGAQEVASLRRYFARSSPRANG